MKNLAWLFCISLFLLQGFTATAQTDSGVSVAHLHRRGVGYGSDACHEQLIRLKALGARWVALNDFAYMRSISSPQVVSRRDGSLTEADLTKTIQDAHAAGLKVMLKPHLWSREFYQGKWHGDIAMTSEADWDEFFRQYGDYILQQARVAQATKAEALCIGLEYVQASKQEARWRKLIAEVRKVYDGHLTYSAAFAEWKDVKFWDALDSVGISAYFPIAKNDNPNDAEIRAGWDQVYRQLEDFHKQTDKPLWFLELGYTRCVTAGRQPWSYEVTVPDEACQARLIRVALEEAQKRPYIKGVFLWKWFSADAFQRYEGFDPFAIQNNPQVLDVLKQLWLEKSVK